VKFQSALIESICYGGENRISHDVYKFSIEEIDKFNCPVIMKLN